MGNCCSKVDVEEEGAYIVHAKTPLLNNTTAEVTNDQVDLIHSPKVVETRNSSASITSQNEVTHQEKISTIIQTLLDTLVDIKVLILHEDEMSLSSSGGDPLLVENQKKERLNITIQKTSINCVDLTDIITRITGQSGTIDFSSGSSSEDERVHSRTISIADIKRVRGLGRWEKELFENTKKATAKMSVLLTECHNASADQRRANIKQLLPVVEQQLIRVREDATLLIQLLLAQREVRQSSKAISQVIGNDRSTVEGMEPIIKATRVAVSVLLKLEESIGHDLIGDDGAILKSSRGDKTPDLEPPDFISKALGACSYQLFEAVNIISQTHIDPVAQFDMLNKAKGMRGAVVLLQLSITQKDQAMADFHIALAAAARAFSSSIVTLVEAVLAGLIDSSVQRTKTNAFTVQFPSHENSNVWHDIDKSGVILYEDFQSGEPRKIKAATVNGLLLHLVLTDKIDLQYMNILVFTYRSFINPVDFFHKLLELYNVPDATEELVIQTKLISFLKRWIAVQFPDFPEGLVKDIQGWAINVLQPKHPSLAKQLLEVMTNGVQQRSKLRQSLIAIQPKGSFDDISPARFVLQVDPLEIANQLTLIDHQIYSSIRPHELLFQAWNKPHLKHRAPNVLRMISRTNNVVLWVASCILWNPKLVDRAAAMSRLIQVAEHLRKLNNFNTMFAVISGLQLSSVTRLKFSREKVPKKTLQVFDNLVELMSNRRSFKVYREALAAETPPCIPYLGVYLTDLTFIEDGNPDYVTSDGTSYHPGNSPKKRKSASPPKKSYSPPKTIAVSNPPKTILVHMKKRELQFKVINDIQMYQHWKYTLKDTRTPLLEELPRNEESQLYGLSLLREPRDTNKEQLV